MKTHNFTTTLLVGQSPKEVFNAVNKPQNWWSGEIEGSSAKLNDEFTYRYKEIHFSKQRVVEMIPNQKVVWLVTDSRINYTEDINEWTGTKISFEITEKDSKTELRFSHIGLVPEIECFDSCSSTWTQLVHQSLASLITSGEGRQLVLA
ncbi:MAG: hypothetical protein JWR05_161 [Mucilaginibacter sp.]|nr:hypothetical protein [Mucilaginibacter sp.]